MHAFILPEVSWERKGGLFKGMVLRGGVPPPTSKRSVQYAGLTKLRPLSHGPPFPRKAHGDLCEPGY